MNPNTASLITIPRFTDKWRGKVLILGVCLISAWLLPVGYDVRYLLAIITAYLLAVGKELQYRALMINIMDEQLIRVSRQAEELQISIDAMAQKVLACEQRMQESS